MKLVFIFISKDRQASSLLFKRVRYYIYSNVVRSRAVITGDCCLQLSMVVTRPTRRFTFIAKGSSMLTHQKLGVAVLDGQLVLLNR